MDVTQIKKACTETLILRMLSERPQHGYEMAKEVEHRSGGYFSFKHGTLYPILHRLEKDGLIRGTWSRPEEDGTGERPRKTYEITPAGRRYQGRNASAWKEFWSMLQAIVPEVAP